MKRITTLIATLSVLAALSWPAIPARAQETADGPMMSLHDCMQYAIDHSPKTRIQELTNDSYRLDHRDAVMYYVPTISGSSSASTSFGRSIDPETNTYTTNASFYNSYGLSASYTLFNGFAVVDNLKAKRFAVLSGVEEAQQTEDELCLLVIQAFYNVLYQTGFVDLCNDQLEESLTSLKQTQLQEELGLKGRADLLQVEAQVAANEFALVRAQNTLDQYTIKLKEIMFYPNDQTLRLDQSYTQLVSPDAFTQNANDVLNAALSFLPAVHISQFQVKTAHLALHNARWALAPSIYASGSYSTGYVSLIGSNIAADSFGQQLRDRQGQSVGVSMSIPIFNGLRLQSDIKRKKNNLQIAEAQHNQKLKELESQIVSAIADMEGSAKEFIQSDKQMLAQEEAHLANQRKYEEGLLSILELQTSANKNLSAKAERLNAAFSYFIKRHVVNYYNGVSYINQE